MAHRLTGQAREDIIGIDVEGASSFGVRKAEAYHATIERVLRTLADNPRMARERSEISPPLRVHPCGSHIVAHVIEPDEGILIVPASGTGGKTLSTILSARHIPDGRPLVPHLPSHLFIL